MRALFFPGQGSQRVGMGLHMAEEFEPAKRTFQEADEALGFRLSELCWEGPEFELTLTANTQPAILTNSIAVLRTLQAEKGLSYDVCAGHSLGEWTALVAASALDFADAVRLVRLRGQFMQEAVPVGQGAMAAILGLSREDLDAVCLEAAGRDVVSPANFNGGGQVVIAGHKSAVARAVALAKEKGAKRAVPLPVSAPFHCTLMAPAGQKLEEALLDVAARDLRVPVVSNVEAEPYRERIRVKDLLVRQVTAPVRWEESVQRLAKDGVTEALELGTGAVLTGLCKRIAPSIRCEHIGEPNEVKAWGSETRP